MTAIGILQQATHKKTGKPVRNKIFSLSLHVPVEGELISTYAYPETTVQLEETTTKINFKPKWYHGTVSEFFPQGMGYIKTSAIVADMESLGGCSGGPVFSINGNADNWAREI